MQILEFCGSTKYLGRKLTFEEPHQAELNNRIVSGWCHFNQLRHELTAKRYPLHSRLRLFNGTVTPSVMYGSASWTLTKDMVSTLKRTQRRMIRLIVGTPRRRAPTPDDIDGEEPWVDFIKRATQTAEALAQRASVDDWAELYYARKWRWAHRVATQEGDRWSALVTDWDPASHDKRNAHRRHAGLRKRWNDDINEYLQSQHCSAASPIPSDSRWLDREEDFVKFCIGN